MDSRVSSSTGKAVGMGTFVQPRNCSTPSRHYRSKQAFNTTRSPKNGWLLFNQELSFRPLP